ncbi:ABC transporter ATP-binding protein [Virgisporangium ochraceum]
MVDRRLVAAAVGLACRSAPRAAVTQVALSVVVGVLPVGVGVLTKLVVDALAGSDGRSWAAVVGLAVELAAAAVAVAGVPHLRQYVDAEWRRAVGLRAQADMYAAVNRLPGLARLEDPVFRDHLNLAAEAGRTSPIAVAGGGLDVARAGLTVVGFAATLAVLNPWMVAVLVLAAVPTAHAELRLSRQRAELMWTLSPSERRHFFYADLLTGLDAAKEIRLFGLGDLFGRRMLTELRGLDAANRRMDRRELAVQALLAAATAVVAGAALVWAVQAARGGRLSIGDVTLFIAAVAGVQAAIGSAVVQLAQVNGALLHFVHYRTVLDTAPDLAVAADPRPVPALRQGIELRDVWFRYGDGHDWVLRGVDLTIPYGRTVALVGLNGAGKSTLVKLLARFYDPTRGSLRWDGLEYRDLDVTGLRDRIGATFQDFMAYDLTAAENIAVGDAAVLDGTAVDGTVLPDGAAFPDGTVLPDGMGRIVAAARRAGVHDAVAALPRGYATQLSRLFAETPERAAAGLGVDLSGGQRQRVALARSFLRADRDLLILDEPTSGLDAEAEADLHQRLRSLRAGRTTLLISHRMNTVRDADEIVVLRDGVIVEQGDHDGLVAAGGAYARLFTLQAAGYRQASTRGAPADPAMHL